MVEILEATTESQLNDVRSLFRAFVAWHRRRHVSNIHLIDRYFDSAEFERELAELPGKYAPPQGQLLIAYDTQQPAGCVAMRDLGDGTCEMKRMFIPDSFRGKGIGRALADRIMSAARKAGYGRMRLDTSIHQSEALGLYERSGFTRIEPYYPLPPDLVDWLVFMEMKL